MVSMPIASGDDDVHLPAEAMSLVDEFVASIENSEHDVSTWDGKVSLWGLARQELWWMFQNAIISGRPGQKRSEPQDLFNPVGLPYPEANVNDKKATKEVVALDAGTEIEGSSRSVLVPVLEDRYLDLCQPIVEELTRRTGWRSILLSFRSQKVSPHLRELNPIYYRDVLTKDDLTDLETSQEELSMVYQRLGADSSFLARFVISGHDGWEGLQGWLDRLFAQHFPRIAEYVRALHRIMAQVEVSAVLAADQLAQPHRSAIAVGKLLGVPTFLLQHGMFSPETLWTVYPCFADKMLLWGDAFADMLKDGKQGVCPIQVVGNPKLVAVHSDTGNQQIRSQMRDDLGVDPNTKLLVYFAQHPTAFLARETIDQIHRDLTHVAANSAGAVLLVKPHPQDSDDFCQGLEAETHSDRRIVAGKEAELFPLLLAADLVLTVFSTVGLEAIALDKPLVILDYLNSSPHIPYVDYGAAVQVSRREELDSLVNLALHDETLQASLRQGRERFKKDHLCQVGQQASKLIADTLDREAKNPATAHG